MLQNFSHFHPKFMVVRLHEILVMAYEIISCISGKIKVMTDYWYDPCISASSENLCS